VKKTKMAANPMNSLSSKSKEHTRSSVLFVAVFRGSKEEEKTRQNQKLV